MKAVALLFLPCLAIAQQANTTSGQCSPIASRNSGSITINCTGLTAAQRRLLESVPALLTKLLASQMDNTSEILSKLDVCIAQGSDWHLTQEDSKNLADSLKGMHARISVESLLSDHNAALFAEDLKAALKDFSGEEKIPGPLYSANINPNLKGIKIVVSHENFPEAASLQRALRSIGIQADGEISATSPVDLITILVGAKPSPR